MDSAVLLENVVEKARQTRGRVLKPKRRRSLPPVNLLITRVWNNLPECVPKQVRTYLIENANLEARKIQLKPFQINPTPSGDGGVVELSLSVK